MFNTLCLNSSRYLGHQTQLNAVDACQGFPTELTPRGWPYCIVRILDECTPTRCPCKQCYFVTYGNTLKICYVGRTQNLSEF